MIDALSSCFDRSEALHIEAEERAPETPRDPVSCPVCDGSGCGGTEYRHGDPQQEYDVGCERCDGLAELDWDDLSEDEQIEYLQAEVDRLRAEREAA